MFENVLQFYGVDWLAMVVTFIAFWQMGNKERRGFLMMVVANILWLIIGILTGSIAMLVANVAFAVLNARTYMKWSSED